MPEISVKKHTPGPWRYDEKRCGIFAGEKKEDDGLEVGNEVRIVDLYGAMGGDDTDADALLMASAPDLLAALKDVLGVDDDRDHSEEIDEDGDGVCRFCGRVTKAQCTSDDCPGNKARLAIEKAEGKESK